MARALTFYSTSIGKKVVMAITGLLLFGFVIGHMLGNLQVFIGAHQMNEYAAMLKANAALLWGVRLVLLVAVMLHIVAAVQLTRMSRRSRPAGYYYKDVIQADYAARTMRWSGLIIAVFVIYHLLHFTTGTVHPQFDVHDVYRNVIVGFRVWPVAVFYVIAMVALAFHLWHGVWSMFQTLGLINPKSDKIIHRLAAIATLAIALGFVSIPMAVLAGLIS
ncbi:MAG TPA: succinate dehydrogenase cytochrome b subunit [Candidatus Tectomicrobia bacterium]|nr:succinate dehydrogenase cytochrome b subunit [Candidatus Tectomicrobia bacterium]